MPVRIRNAIEGKRNRGENVKPGETKRKRTVTRDVQVGGRLMRRVESMNCQEVVTTRKITGS